MDRIAMLRYVGWWTRCASLAVAVGIGLAFLLWSPGEALAIWCVGTVAVGVLLAVSAPPAGPERPASAFRWSRLGCRSLAAGAVVVALAAGVSAVPALAWPLATVVVLSSPPVVDRVLAVRAAATARPEPLSPGGTGAHAAVPGPGEPSGVPPARSRAVPRDDGPATRSTGAGAGAGAAPLSEAGVRELGDLDLCLLWRRSFVRLESASSASRRTRLVDDRQLLLDELERRSPTALAAWLASGARAASGPERFLGHRPGTGAGHSDAA